MPATLSFSVGDPSIVSVEGHPVTLPPGYAGPYPPAPKYIATFVAGTSSGTTYVNEIATHPDGIVYYYHPLAVTNLFGPVGGAITPQENPGQGNESEPQAAGDCNCEGDPVGTAFGTFTESFDDFAIPSRGLALSFTHTYNSAFATTNSPLGYGWTHPYAMNLAVNKTTGSVTITQENGSQVSFNLSAGKYRAAPRVIATLVKNGDGSFTFTRRAQEFFTFSPTGQLIAEHDRNGYVTSLAYSGTKLISITDPAGHKLTLTYSGSNISRVTDPIGRHIDFAYDTNGNLVKVINVAGGQTSFTYSPAHLLLTITDPRGGVVINQYDASNRVITQTDQLGRKTTFAYTSGTTTVTDPKGNVSQESYLFGERLSLTKGFGTSSAATWKFAYDPATAGLTSVTDPNGHVSTTTYDASGNPLQSTDGLGRVTTRTWDPMNDLTSITDPIGVKSTLTYDAHGNLLSRSRPLTGSALVQTLTYQYGDGSHPGDVTGVVDPDGKTTTYKYDAAGDRISETDPLGDLTAFGYNGIGWRTSLTNARKNPATYAYNSFGDLTVTTDPIGNKVTRGYDPNRNLATLTDGDGHTTTYIYDAANERTTTKRADGTILQTVYNADGTVQKTIDGAGHATLYGYDPLARVISISDPLGRVTKYTYDGAGNQLTLTDPFGRVTTRSYDTANQLVGIKYSDGKTPNVTMAYDADRQRISMTDGTGTSTWAYDSLHRVTSTKSGAGATVAYAYDLKGQLTKLTYPGGIHAVSRTYDAAGRMTSVVDWLGNTSRFAYDPDGNMTTETFPTTTGIVGKFSYNSDDVVDGMTYQKGTTAIANFSYSRDANQQLTLAAETGVPVSPVNTYGYTPLNQLANVNKSDYAYDTADNITGLINPAATLSYDAANELSSLTSAGKTTTFSYNAQGNRVGKTPPGGTGLTYAYDQANRLTAFGSSSTYRYDGDGLRMSKTLTGTTQTFTWDRSGPLPLVIVEGASYVYGPGGVPLEQVSASGTALFYLHDQQGSTRLLTDSLGAVKASYTYDPYGNVLAQTGTVTNPFGYTGQFADTESGLLYLRARYYDPATAQFLTRDPLSSLTQQPYAYADADPFDLTDPSGLSDTFLDPSTAEQVKSAASSGVIVCAAAGANAAFKVPLELGQTVLEAGNSAREGGLEGLAIYGIGKLAQLATEAGVTGFLSEVGATIAGGVSGGVVTGLLSSTEAGEGEDEIVAERNAAAALANAGLPALEDLPPSHPQDFLNPAWSTSATAIILP